MHEKIIGHSGQYVIEQHRLNMENPYDKIELYLLGEMEEPEKSAFEEAVEKDAGLKTSLAQHRTGVAQLDAARLRGKVKAEMLKTKKHGSNLWAWALGAALLALLAYWSLPFNQTEAPSPQSAPAPSPVPTPPIAGTQTGTLPDNNRPNPALALAKRYQQRPTLDMLRSTSPDGSSAALRDALDAYEQGAYSTALQRLSEVPKLQENEIALFLRASVYFAQGNFDQAARDFEGLATSFQYKHDAHWNYVLCLWASGDARAKTLMDNIASDPDSPFRKEAMLLMKQMATN
jgi:tetratricopeptide (TPR) repeat protein